MSNLRTVMAKAWTQFTLHQLTKLPDNQWLNPAYEQAYSRGYADSDPVILFEGGIEISVYGMVYNIFHGKALIMLGGYYQNIGDYPKRAKFMCSRDFQTFRKLYLYGIEYLKHGDDYDY